MGGKGEGEKAIVAMRISLMIKVETIRQRPSIATIYDVTILQYSAG